MRDALYWSWNQRGAECTVVMLFDDVCIDSLFLFYLFTCFLLNLSPSHSLLLLKKKIHPIEMHYEILHLVPHPCCAMTCGGGAVMMKMVVTVCVWPHDPAPSPK